MSQVHFGPRIVRDGLFSLWDAANKRSYPGAGDEWFDIISGHVLNRIGNVAFDPAGYFSFNTGQITEWFENLAYPMPNEHTIECWFRARTVQQQAPWTYSVNGPQNTLVQTIETNRFNLLTVTAQQARSNIEIPIDTWHCFTRTRDATTGQAKAYLNGEHVLTMEAGNSNITGGYLIVGQEIDLAPPDYGFVSTQNLDGEFSILSVYSRILSDAEITQNFHAMRSRYRP